MDPEEFKKIQEASAKAVKDSMAAAEEKIKKESEAKIAEHKKQLDDAVSKITELEKKISHKGFHIGSDKFPSRLKIANTEYRMDSVGTGEFQNVAMTKALPKLKYFGKDTEESYNFRKYLLTIARLCIDKSGNYPELRESLNQMIAPFAESDPVVKAAMVEGTVGVGGYYVLPQYETELVRLVREDSFALQECNTAIKMSAKDAYLPSEGSGFTAYWVDEVGSITASSFVSSQIQLTAKKLAVLTDVISNELIQDSAFDLVSYISEAIAYAMSQKIDYDVLFGSTSPWGGNIGLFTSAVSNSRTITGTPATSFKGMTDEDLSYAMQELSVKDSVNSKWIFGKLVSHYLRTLKDNDGSPIFVSPSSPVIPKTIYGAPYSEWKQAELSDAANTVFGVYGDLKQFIIAQRIGFMGLDSDPYTNFATDQTRFRTTSRWALKLRRASAFCKIKTATA